MHKVNMKIVVLYIVARAESDWFTRKLRKLGTVGWHREKFVDWWFWPCWSVSCSGHCCAPVRFRIGPAAACWSQVIFHTNSYCVCLPPDSDVSWHIEFDCLRPGNSAAFWWPLVLMELPVRVYRNWACLQFKSIIKSQYQICSSILDFSMVVIRAYIFLQIQSWRVAAVYFNFW